VDLSCLAKGRASVPGAACKARQRPGKAGSTAFAWVLLAYLTPVLAGDGRTPLPVVEPATAGTQCVEPADVMRRNHMRFLEHQRDATVHGGVRGAKHSLKACIDCHASAKTASVAAAGTDFCVSCHSYAAVRIDCFECHSSKSAKKLAQGATK
jgi:predicted CXXCH cytochrome family protein